MLELSGISTERPNFACDTMNSLTAQKYKPTTNYNFGLIGQTDSLKEAYDCSFGNCPCLEQVQIFLAVIFFIIIILY